MMDRVLINILVNEFDCEPEAAEKAVLKASHLTDPTVKNALDEVAERIYSIQEYWD